MKSKRLIVIMVIASMMTITVGCGGEKKKAGI